MDMDDELKKLKLRRLKALTVYYEAETELRRQLDGQLDEIESETARLLDTNYALPCLVRKTQGPDHTVYHSADAPCGRVRDRRNFKTVGEWTAMEEGDYWYLLNRCTACDWKKAARVKAQQEQR
ncbi:hypothetical protein [Streptomyces sp. NPDC096068]|uniref:hypothetical protein n=1 Tax=Streptomyces sp. NPDC096068 TaxID=3155424 RepID=UPI00332B8E67